MERFGKPSAPLLDARGHLLTATGNDSLVERTRRLYECYRAQPRRTRCKICDSALQASPIFEKFDIPYFVCGTCEHLNGGFEDTPAFNAFQFTGEASEAAVAHYSEADHAAYRRRTDDIYSPKVEFLFEALRQAGADPAALRHADLGAGSGYFVAALRQAGIPAPIGYDVSREQVDLANRMLGAPLIRLHKMGELIDLAGSIEADVVSMIFTLEHVERPRELLSALYANPNVRFVFFSVPTVAPVMFFELVFPTVFERHLSTHTHLFSDRSLHWLAQATGFERLAEWWFGSDAMDFYRSVAVRMRQIGQSEAAVEGWTAMMRPLIDGWQLAIDQHKLSSAVHLVLRKSVQPRI
jgi:2-polyprenyl-3-methyl-5-hydroxy-6-metoxy-1,4-benzoquinol methylase